MLLQAIQEAQKDCLKDWIGSYKTKQHNSPQHSIVLGFYVMEKENYCVKQVVLSLKQQKKNDALKSGCLFAIRK